MLTREELKVVYASLTVSAKLIFREFDEGRINVKVYEKRYGEVNRIIAKIEQHFNQQGWNI